MRYIIAIHASHSLLERSAGGRRVLPRGTVCKYALKSNNFIVSAMNNVLQL